MGSSRGWTGIRTSAPQGRGRVVSGAACQLLRCHHGGGRRRRDRLGQRPFAELLGCTGADELLGESCFEFLSAAVADEATAGGTRSMSITPQGSEQALRRRDGRRVPVEVTIAPIDDSPDPSCRVLFRLRDISNYQRLERATSASRPRQQTCSKSVSRSAPENSRPSLRSRTTSPQS